MSLVTWWLKARQTKQIGGDLIPPATAGELAWWAGERRRLFWKYAFRQGLPLAGATLLSAIFAAAHDGHLTAGRLPGFVAIAAGAFLLSGYCFGRLTSESQQAMSIRRHRLREAMDASSPLRSLSSSE